ncbi:hypothetical protein JYU34_013435 [Plutella xylostella]|uniref:Peptidase S1 domain-containing protein n=1 Tax=Plutella xylostella TaxID=51655 RepID=A0ABQ7Q9S7_PLUXY|nr:hypothetical protein JYU34_013435 [Plutella xylostella]
MRGLVLLVLVAAAAAADLHDAAYIANYHELVGIPHATRIKEMEDQWLSSPLHRIVGGAASAISSHPYLAGLVITFPNGARSACGSTLLSANRLVTAAHCWVDSVNQAAQFEVVLGSQYLFSGGTRIVTTQVYTHPSYNPRISPIAFDVAMIYLPTRVTFNANIAPVDLPFTTDITEQFAGVTATAIGYGKTTDLESLTLQTFRREVSLQVMAQPQCITAWAAGTIQDYNLCTAGRSLQSTNVGVCGGDSGGPLTTVRNGRRVLIGVISFAAAQQCHSGFASGYSRTTSFYQFILEHLLVN